MLLQAFSAFQVQHGAVTCGALDCVPAELVSSQRHPWGFSLQRTIHKLEPDTFRFAVSICPLILARLRSAVASFLISQQLTVTFTACLAAFGSALGLRGFYTARCVPPPLASALLACTRKRWPRSVFAIRSDTSLMFAAAPIKLAFDLHPCHSSHKQPAGCASPIAAYSAFASYTSLDFAVPRNSIPRERLACATAHTPIEPPNDPPFFGDFH